MVGLRPRLIRAVPALFTIVVFCILTGLGVWQLQRLAWKEGRISTLEERSRQASLVYEGQTLTRAEHEFRILTIEGHWWPDQELFKVGRSRRGEPGFHVFVPLLTGQGLLVLLNRGFVPPEHKDRATRPEDFSGDLSGDVSEDLSSGAGVPVQVSAMVRFPPPRESVFTPPNEPHNNLWFSVAPSQMALYLSESPALEPPAAVESSSLETRLVAPFYLLADVNPYGPLPEGAPWRVEIRNFHLQYALTWFGLALSLLGVYFFYRRSQKHPEQPEHPAQK